MPNNNNAEYFSVILDMAAQVRGGKEAEKIIEGLNKQYQGLQRTQDSVTGRNANLVGDNLRGAFEAANEAGSNIENFGKFADAAFGSLNKNGYVTSEVFGNISADLKSITETISGSRLNLSENMSVGDLAAAYRKTVTDMQKAQENLGRTVGAIQMRMTTSLKNLQAEYDVVAAKADVYRKVLEETPITATKEQAEQYQTLADALSDIVAKEMQAVSAAAAEEKAISQSIKDVLTANKSIDDSFLKTTLPDGKVVDNPLKSQIEYLRENNPNGLFDSIINKYDEVQNAMRATSAAAAFEKQPIIDSMNEIRAAMSSGMTWAEYFDLDDKKTAAVKVLDEQKGKLEELQSKYASLQKQEQEAIASLDVWKRKQDELNQNAANYDADALEMERAVLSDAISKGEERLGKIGEVLKQYPEQIAKANGELIQCQATVDSLSMAMEEAGGSLGNAGTAAARKIQAELEKSDKQLENLSKRAARVIDSGMAEEQSATARSMTTLLDAAMANAKVGEFAQAAGFDMKELSNTSSNVTRTVAEGAHKCAEEYGNLREQINGTLTTVQADTSAVREQEESTKRAADEMGNLSSNASVFSKIFLGNSAKHLNEQLTEVQRKMNVLSQQKIQTDKFKENEKNIASATKALESYQKKLDGMEADGVDSSSTRFKGLKRAIDDTTKSLKEYNKTRAAMLADGSAYTSGSDTEEYRNLERRAETLRSHMNDTFSKQNPFRDAWAAGVKSFSATAKKELNAVSKLINRITSGVKNWHKNQKSITDQAKATFKTFTNLWSMLKTRAKRKFVGLVFQDVVDTVGSIAKMSPRFNEALSGFISSSKTLGSQIIAAFEPLASVVLPVLTTFIDKLTEGTQQLAQFISRSTGNAQFIKASKGQYDYAASLDKTTSSTNKATKATKAFKSEVLSFDQLHKLSGTDDTDDLLPVGVDFEKANNDANAINELGERLWDALTAHDYREAGKVLADGVNMAFDWMKNVAGWEANGEKLTNILNGITDAANGFVAGLKDELIGQSIGDILNTPIELMKQWTGSFNYIELGKKLGGILGNAVKTINWTDLGIGIIQGIQGVINIANGFMSKQFLNSETGKMESIFAVLGHAVSNMITGMISSLKPDDWSDLISGFFNGLFEFIGTALEDPAKWGELGRKLAETVNKTFAKLDASKISGGINAFTQAFNSLITSAFDNLNGSLIIDKLGEILKGLDWGSLGKTVAIFFTPALISGFSSGIGSLLKTGGQAFLLKSILGGGGTAGAGAGAGGFSISSCLTTMLDKICGLALAIFAIETTVRAIDLFLNPKKHAEQYVETKKEAQEKGVGFVGGIDMSGVRVGGKAVTIGNVWEAIFKKPSNYTLAEAETRGETTVVTESLVDPLSTAMSQEFANMRAEREGTLSDMDGETFTSTLMTGVREATALPTESLAAQNSEAFVTAIKDGVRDSMMDVMMTVMDSDNSDTGDIVLRIDSEDVARASMRGMRKMNKRQDPLVASFT